MLVRQQAFPFQPQPHVGKSHRKQKSRNQAVVMSGKAILWHLLDTKTKFGPTRPLLPVLVSIILSPRSVACGGHVAMSVPLELHSVCPTVLVTDWRGHLLHTVQ